MRSLEEHCFAWFTPEITHLTHATPRHTIPPTVKHARVTAPHTAYLLLGFTVHGQLRTVMADLCCHVLQWFKLFLRHQVELHYEVEKVFVAGIDVSFLWETRAWMRFRVREVRKCLLYEKSIILEISSIANWNMILIFIQPLHFFFLLLYCLFFKGTLAGVCRISLPLIPCP